MDIDDTFIISLLFHRPQIHARDANKYKHHRRDTF